MVVGLLIIYTTISGIIGYRATSDSLYDQYTEDAFQVANAAAFVVDGDELDEMIRDGEDSELYRETWNRLDQLCNAFDATFVYVIQPDLTDQIFRERYPGFTMLCQPRGDYAYYHMGDANG